jgi:hypothetical protein
MEDPAYSELVQNEPTRSALRRDDTQVVGSDAIHPRSAVIREARQGPDPRGKLAGVGKKDGSRVLPAIMARSERVRCTNAAPPYSARHPQAQHAGPFVRPNEESPGYSADAGAYAAIPDSR